MTPAQRCRRGQRLRTAQGDLAPQVAAACSQKLLPQHSVCTLETAKCQTTALLMDMWRNSFTAVPKGLRAQQEPGGAGQGSRSSPGVPFLQERRSRAGKGQETFSCSCFLPSAFPLAMPVLTFVPLSPLCLL